MSKSSKKVRESYQTHFFDFKNWQMAKLVDALVIFTARNIAKAVPIIKN